MAFSLSSINTFFKSAFSKIKMAKKTTIFAIIAIFFIIIIIYNIINRGLFEGLTTENEDSEEKASASASTAETKKGSTKKETDGVKPSIATTATSNTTLNSAELLEAITSMIQKGNSATTATIPSK